MHTNSIMPKLIIDSERCFFARPNESNISDVLWPIMYANEKENVGKNREISADRR